MKETNTPPFHLIKEKRAHIVISCFLDFRIKMTANDGLTFLHGEGKTISCWVSGMF